VAEIGGDKGDWTMVRSRKRKAMQPEARRRDRSRALERHGGTVQARVRDRRDFVDSDRYQRYYSGTRQYQQEGRVSKKVGGNYDVVDRRDHDFGKEGFDFATAADKGGKVSFYFTNFPDSMNMVQLRQLFEVYGMLSDVYIAKKQNYRGQVYGFLRFLNVKNIDKLAIALNNVWIGQCRIWAREARFDKFASGSTKGGRRKQEKVDVLPVTRVTGKGIKNVRVGSREEGKRGEGEKVRLWGWKR